MRYISFFLLCCLLVLTGCSKSGNKQNWVKFEGYDFSVNMSHFADFVQTDEVGQVYGTQHYGINGDNNDWEVFEYKGKSKSSKDYLTGLSSEDDINDISMQMPRSFTKSSNHLDGKPAKDGTIEPGVPEVIDLSDFGINEPFIINTPSLQEVPTTPIINYVITPGSVIPIEFKNKTDIYYYRLGIMLSTSSPNDHSRVSITVPAGTWYSLAYYDGDWQQPSEYPVVGPATLYWDDIPFTQAVNTVFSNNDPCVPPAVIPFMAELTSSFDVKLTWHSYTQYTYQGFDILRSQNNDLISAEVLNQYPITNGTVNGDQITYSFTDTNHDYNITYYYWLQIYNNDESINFYGPISITIPQDPMPPPPIINKVYPAYPNANNGFFSVKFCLSNTTNVNLLIINEQYEVVRSYLWTKPSGAYHYVVDIRDKPKGLYRIYFWMETAEKTYYAYGDVLKIID